MNNKTEIEINEFLSDLNDEVRAVQGCGCCSHASSMDVVKFVADFLGYEIESSASTAPRASESSPATPAETE